MLSAPWGVDRPYVRWLVDQIRTGRRVSELFDQNSLYLPDHRPDFAARPPLIIHTTAEDLAFREGMQRAAREREAAKAVAWKRELAQRRLRNLAAKKEREREQAAWHAEQRREVERQRAAERKRFDRRLWHEAEWRAFEPAQPVTLSEKDLLVAEVRRLMDLRTRADPATWLAARDDWVMRARAWEAAHGELLSWAA
jgi:hypothetical protein